MLKYSKIALFHAEILKITWTRRPGHIGSELSQNFHWSLTQTILSFSQAAVLECLGGLKIRRKSILCHNILYAFHHHQYYVCCFFSSNKICHLGDVDTYYFLVEIRKTHVCQTGSVKF